MPWYLFFGFILFLYPSHYSPFQELIQNPSPCILHSIPWNVFQSLYEHYWLHPDRAEKVAVPSKKAEYVLNNSHNNAK